MDAEETVALFAKLTEEEVNEELPEGHSYKYFSEGQWTIDDNPVIFLTGETKKTVTISFVEPHVRVFLRYMCLDYMYARLRKKRK